MSIACSQPEIHRLRYRLLCSFFSHIGWCIFLRTWWFGTFLLVNCSRNSTNNTVHTSVGTRRKPRNWCPRGGWYLSKQLPYSTGTSRPNRDPCDRSLFSIDGVESYSDETGWSRFDRRHSWFGRLTFAGSRSHSVRWCGKQIYSCAVDLILLWWK